MVIRETTRFRDQVLLEFETLICPLGFARRAKAQSFRRVVGDDDHHWIHLNFGLYESTGQFILNPSVGTRLARFEEDLIDARVISSDVRGVSGTFGQMLQSLSGRSYHGDISRLPRAVASLVFDDWIRFGQHAVQRMSDLGSVVSMLRSESAKEWCCTSRSGRARMLPLALVHLGLIDDAFRALEQMESDLRGRDQMLPSFDDFRRWFHSRWRSQRA